MASYLCFKLVGFLKQLDVNSINHFYKVFKKKLEFHCLYNLTDLKLGHIFYANVIEHCHQNRYLQLANYTELLTVKAFFVLKILKFLS